MADIPNTRFLNFVSTPAVVAYNKFGNATINLDPQTPGVVELNGFRKVSLLIGTTKAASFEVHIGKISGSTLAQSFSRAIDQKIHTFDVIGPQMSLTLKGAANTHEKVQLWVYLSS